MTSTDSLTLRPPHPLYNFGYARAFETSFTECRVPVEPLRTHDSAVKSIRTYVESSSANEAVIEQCRLSVSAQLQMYHTLKHGCSKHIYVRHPTDSITANAPLVLMIWQTSPSFGTSNRALHTNSHHAHLLMMLNLYCIRLYNHAVQLENALDIESASYEANAVACCSAYKQCAASMMVANVISRRRCKTTQYQNLPYECSSEINRAMYLYMAAKQQLAVLRVMSIREAHRITMQHYQHVVAQCSGALELLMQNRKPEDLEQSDVLRKMQTFYHIAACCMFIQASEEYHDREAEDDMYIIRTCVLVHMAMRQMVRYRACAAVSGVGVCASDLEALEKRIAAMKTEVDKDHRTRIVNESTVVTYMPNVPKYIRDLEQYTSADICSDKILQEAKVMAPEMFIGGAHYEHALTTTAAATPTKLSTGSSSGRSVSARTKTVTAVRPAAAAAAQSVPEQEPLVDQKVAMLLADD